MLYYTRKLFLFESLNVLGCNAEVSLKEQTGFVPWWDWKMMSQPLGANVCWGHKLLSLGASR